MNVWQALKMAFSSIMANKLRSLLTTLGIIIGVTSVIALVGLGQGTSQSITEQVQGLGTNLITLNIFGRGSTDSLQLEDALSLADIDGVAYVAPVNSQSGEVKYGTTSTSVSILGTTTDYLIVQNYELATGRFVADLDQEYYQKVAVLGATTATELFGYDNPIGEYIQIQGTRYKVIGVLAEEGEDTTGSKDEVVVIPITSSERLFQSQGVRTVYLQATSEDAIQMAKTGLEETVSELFRGNTDSYRVMSQDELLETMTSVTDTMTLALAGIAGISLVVGGIGIMNIMLVSVTERTREIGIRKAIGARKRDILIQFLIEAIVLSGMGGLLGIAIGIGIGNLASQLLGMEVVFSLDVIGFAFGFSVIVGIVFGLFPANKAAGLRPIDALRYQ